ncbi:hypothetical protein DL89DRAFT_270748 [Linderina pennispora]|uniref:Uncharacterized protein n=1 Tax=Linderina pennispora TaxID=61395 RepID=A0A1Y1VWL1_9FUNG|nr:uncharacterized protein DL89DRAFT_270748 [Linderina pennispora]ORX65687.1 hypothetical protein DL89DRAFT_270748 [Linderina pennispora]
MCHSLADPCTVTLSDACRLKCQKRPGLGIAVFGRELWTGRSRAREIKQQLSILFSASTGLSALVDVYLWHAAVAMPRYEHWHGFNQEQVAPKSAAVWPKNTQHSRMQPDFLPCPRWQSGIFRRGAHCA